MRLPTTSKFEAVESLLYLCIMTQAFPYTHRRYTLEEYLEIDAEGGIRHEYIDGQIIDMAGSSNPHGQITTNLVGLLWLMMRGKPCQGRDGSLRIRYGKKVDYGYPDAVIICGELKFDPIGKGNTTLTNPAVLFEVLSDSTEAYDRGRKFERYREIESFKEYVLIAQDRPSVEIYRRQESGLWAFQHYLGMGAEAQILTVGIGLQLAEIYAGVVFPATNDEGTQLHEK